MAIIKMTEKQTQALKEVAKGNIRQVQTPNPRGAGTVRIYDCDPRNPIRSQVLTALVNKGLIRNRPGKFSSTSWAMELTQDGQETYDSLSCMDKPTISAAPAQEIHTTSSVTRCNWCGLSTIPTRFCPVPKIKTIAPIRYHGKDQYICENCKASMDDAEGCQVIDELHDPEKLQYFLDAVPEVPPPSQETFEEDKVEILRSKSPY